MKNLSYHKSHDLSLPQWGPYSKRFFGLSHIADSLHGHRFDLTVIPALYRRTLAVPDALRNSNYLPWQASSDLKNYAYRQQLIWKDQVYVDVSFAEISEEFRLISCLCVNHTDSEQNLAIHLALALELNPQEKVQIQLPPNGIWLNAARHGQVQFAVPRVTDHLNPEGTHRGEMRCPDAIDGSVIGRGLGGDPGDKLTLALPHVLGSAEKVFICYRVSSAITVQYNGEQLTLPEQNQFAFQQLPSATDCEELELIIQSAQAIEINGFAIVSDDTKPQIVPRTAQRMPHFESGPEKNSLLLSYAGIDTKYGLWWSFDSDFVRHYPVDDFNKILYYSDSVHQRYLAPKPERECQDNFLDVVWQPIPLAPGETRTIYAIVGNGNPNDIATNLQSIPKSPEFLKSIYEQSRQRWVSTPASPWQFSQERMAAVMLTNVVYPIYVADQYIRHHTPGRRWNCLYTWDSGFIGLGFLELDLQRAEESLNTYLTAPGDPENAFIHRGSLVPMQIYLFHELWNRSGNNALVKRYYPALKQYYDFMAGHDPQSTTRCHSQEALICTWDYFYNSGGWDDYPPQWEIRQRRAKNILPVVPTAHVIRAAKILRFAAKFLNLEADVRQFDADIRNMSHALQSVAWDAQAGVFSYVIHDESGQAQGFFRAPDGSNFNLGLDGLSPLLADEVTAEQRELFWEKLSSPQHFWTPAGLSTVDQSASYYRTDGYWNGAVWLPYIYFFWKAALNDGRGDFAWQLASTALNIWERETQDSYACFEQFNARTGKGQGWHHFSALSSPVVIFHGAYATPYRLTCGNNWHCAAVKFAAHGLTANLNSCGKSGTPSMLIVTLPSNKEYVAWINGQAATPTVRRPGCLEIYLTHQEEVTLTIGEKQF